MTRLPEKPKYGSTCNGCGLCCAKEICPAGVMAFPGAVAPCPGLRIAPDHNRTYCELVMVESIHNLAPMLQRALAIGFGCTMADADTTQEEWDLQEALIVDWKDKMYPKATVNKET